MILGTLGKTTPMVLIASQEVWIDDSCHCGECFQALSAYFPLRFNSIILHSHAAFHPKGCWSASPTTYSTAEEGENSKHS